VRAGIIAAGDGSRLVAGGVLEPKPLVRVGGMTLVERTLRSLEACGIESAAIIVNDRMARVADHVAGLGLRLPVEVIVRTTPSSLHSLHELRLALGEGRFVLCTVDSILRASDFAGFVRAFRELRGEEALLSYTSFVDDENPLRIALGEDGRRVVALGEQAAASPFVTVGLYGLSSAVFPLLEDAVRRGTERLRRFLALLIDAGVPVLGHQVGKAIDVDRPSDIFVAEAFLMEQDAPALRSGSPVGDRPEDRHPGSLSGER
jgi:NDP-sugar pyrophosphorylase family protein